jgi:hypothetical protein
MCSPRSVVEDWRIAVGNTHHDLPGIPRHPSSSPQSSKQIIVSRRYLRKVEQVCIERRDLSRASSLANPVGYGRGAWEWVTPRNKA